MAVSLLGRVGMATWSCFWGSSISSNSGSSISSGSGSSISSSNGNISAMLWGKGEVVRILMAKGIPSWSGPALAQAWLGPLAVQGPDSS